MITLKKRVVQSVMPMNVLINDAKLDGSLIKLYFDKHNMYSINFSIGKELDSKPCIIARVNSFATIGFLENLTAQTARIHILFDFKQSINSAAH